jgi:hypothetical protein
VIRPTRCFRPSLEKFDKKTLLSAGQVAHLVAGPDAADEFRYYFRIRNDTGHQVKVIYAVAAITFDGGTFTLPNKKERTIETKPVEGSAGQVLISYDGKPSFLISSKSGPPKPANDQLILTTLT